MRIISSKYGGGTVKEALDRVGKEINRKLADTPGSISSFESEINVGFAGANVRLIVTVDEREIQNKRFIWVNRGGSNEEEALTKAEEEMNPVMEKIRGEIADFYIEFVSPPLPQRVYVTMIAGVNESVPEETEELTAKERRARIARIVNLLGNEPDAVNISKTAEIFGVSRDIIYRDLEKMGFER